MQLHYEADGLLHGQFSIILHDDLQNMNTFIYQELLEINTTNIAANDSCLYFQSAAWNTILFSL